MTRLITLSCLLVALASLTAAEHDHAHDDHGHDHGDHGHAHDDHGHDHDAQAHADDERQVIPLPAATRDLLGVRFVAAERRAVAAVRRVPGFFEALPAAQHHYPLPVTGRITVHAEILGSVRRGDLLYEVDAPRWHEIQGDLHAAAAAQATAEADLSRIRAERAAAQRVAGDDFDSELYAARVAAAEGDLAAARGRWHAALAGAAALTALSEDDLLAEEDGRPRWQRMERIPVRAASGGLVREIDGTSGTWVEAGEEVVHVVDPDHLHFHGSALQADLIDHLHDGQAAVILPPPGHGRDPVSGIPGHLRLGVGGDPRTRTVEIIVDIDTDDPPPWARPQVAAIAEVVVAGSRSQALLAVPEAAIVEDGLERVVFWRDPEHPDLVHRLPVQPGVRGAGWVAVTGELMAGDQVVTDGAYQLHLATQDQGGGEGGEIHVGPDGSIHRH